MDSILTDLPHYLLGIGLLLLLGEVLLGFTTILLLTLGLSMMATSGLIHLGILDPELLNAFIAVSVIDTLLTVALWKPMKKLQQDKAPKETTSDLIGATFDLVEDAGPGKKSHARFSGTSWTVKANTEIAAGVTVRILKVEVGTLHVAQA